MQLTDSSGETHQFSKNTGQGGLIDFKGWKEISIDLDSGHETWGGDKNGRLDFPVTAISFGVGQPTDGTRLVPVESSIAFDDLSVQSEKSAWKPWAATYPSSRRHTAPT